MSASECLKNAGEAAELLEAMGFIAVARLRDGIVTLECWHPGPGASRVVRHTIDDPSLSRAAIAQACAAALRATQRSTLS